MSIGHFDVTFCTRPILNPVIPEFLKIILQSLNLDLYIVATSGLSQNSITAWQTVKIQMRRFIMFEKLSILMKGARLD